MKKLLIILFILVISGCQTNDVRITPIIEGQTALHAGYNVGPELYLQAGQRAKVTGAVIYIRGTEPDVLIQDNKMISK